MTVEDEGRTAQDVIGKAISHYLLLGYADDTAMAARNHLWLQNALDLFVNSLRFSGFEVKTDKTKLMTCHPGHIYSHLSTPAYTR